MTGVRPQQLAEAPPCPRILARAFYWFLDLSSRRGVAVGMGAVALPISYQELDAWARYTGNRPTHLERRAIDVFDQVYLRVVNAPKE